MTTTAEQCQIRLNQMLNNVPPARYTPPSPYPQYTQYQLDMRRKAEILKYNNSNGGSKTNNPTKRQNFAYIVNRAARGGVTSTLSQQCSQSDNGASTPLPSYYSGVPGPVTMLFNDPTIPLYKYSSTKPTFSAQEGEPVAQPL